MASAHETLEHAEHAAHAGHSGKTGTYIGLTMAVLGVLLAFCSAMVGAERTELIKTMVEQQNAQSKYQAQNTKHRMVLTQLLAVHSSVVTPAETAAADAAFDVLKKTPTTDAAAAEHAAPAAEHAAPAAEHAATTAAAAAHGATAPAGEHPATASAAAPAAGMSDAQADALIQGLKIATHQITQTLSPEREDVLNLITLARKYDKERDVAKEWSEAFEESIHAHSESAEHFEWGQLAAEVGIVIASIALLMSSRKIWGVSLVLGVACIAVVVHTRVTFGKEIAESAEVVEHKEKAYKELRKAGSMVAEDEDFLKSIEAVLGKAAAPKAAAAGEHGGAEHGKDEHGGAEHGKDEHGAGHGH